MLHAFKDHNNLQTVISVIEWLFVLFYTGKGSTKMDMASQHKLPISAGRQDRFLQVGTHTLAEYKKYVILLEFKYIVGISRNFVRQTGRS